MSGEEWQPAFAWLRGDCQEVGHTWPIVPSMRDDGNIWSPSDDRCHRCGMRRVIHEDGSRTYTYNPVLNQPTTTDKESVMDSIFNITNPTLAQAAALISQAREVVSNELLDHPNDGGLRTAWDNLGRVIDLTCSADEEWEAFIDEQEKQLVNMWDATLWHKAQDGDLIKLLDPEARDNGGPVYRIDGVPAWRADRTLSVVANLIEVAGSPWNWPLGPSVMEFSEDCWQIWHDFSDSVSS